MSNVFDLYIDDRSLQEQLEDIRERQAALMGTAEEYGRESAEIAEFKPYTVASSLGGAQTSVDPETGALSVSIDKSPEELALEQDLLGGSATMFERAMADPNVAQADLYEQIRAVQRPEEERQALALEERMLSQGRMGLGSATYGGTSPELLAQEQARQEAMLKANLSARTQSLAELSQFGDMGTKMLAGAYTPQTEAIGLLGAGTNVAQLQDLGSRQGASLYNAMMQKAFDPYTTMLDAEYELKKKRDEAYYDAIKDLF
jgi:hypothetical protein